VNFDAAELRCQKVASYIGYLETLQVQVSAEQCVNEYVKMEKYRKRSCIEVAVWEISSAVE